MDHPQGTTSVSTQVRLRAPGKLAKTNYVNEVVNALSPRGHNGQINRQDADQTVVPILNNSGVDVPPFGVLGIDSIVFDPSTNYEAFVGRPTLMGVTPVVADHTGYFVVAREPIKFGDIGSASICGLFWAKVEITSLADLFADVKASVAELKTGPTGSAKIIWMEQTTGAGKWALLLSPAGGGSGDILIGIARWNGLGIAGTDVLDPSWQYDYWAKDADPDVDDPIATGKQPYFRNSIPAQKAPDDSYCQYTYVDGDPVLLRVREKDVKAPCV